MRRVAGKLMAVLILAASAVLSVGCGPTWPKDISVKLDPSLNNAGAWKQVRVHLIGTGDRARITELKKMNMSDYWQPDGKSQQPDPDRVAMDLGPAAQSQTVSHNDPIWGRWQNSSHPVLFVLADLREPDHEGDADDSRRIILPLEKGRWPGGLDVIRISIERGRIRVLTPPSE